MTLGPKAASRAGPREDGYDASDDGRWSVSLVLAVVAVEVFLVSYPG